MGESKGPGCGVCGRNGQVEHEKGKPIWSRSGLLRPDFGILFEPPGPAGLAVKERGSG